MAIYFSMFIAGVVNSNLAVIPIGACLGAVGALAGLYIAGSVAGYGVKGVTFNRELYELENPEKNSKEDRK